VIALRNVGGKACPTFVCDHCGDVVPTHAGGHPGWVFFRFPLHEGDSVQAHVIHEGNCRAITELALTAPRPPGAGADVWTPLPVFALELVSNLSHMADPRRG